MSPIFTKCQYCRYYEPRKILQCLKHKIDTYFDSTCNDFEMDPEIGRTEAIKRKIGWKAQCTEGVKDGQ